MKVLCHIGGNMKVFQYVSLQIAYRHTTILLGKVSFFLLHFHSFYIVLSQNTASVYSLNLLSIKFMKEPILYGLIQVGLPLPKMAKEYTFVLVVWKCCLQCICAHSDYEQLDYCGSGENSSTEGSIYITN